MQFAASSRAPSSPRYVIACWLARLDQVIALPSLQRYEHREGSVIVSITILQIPIGGEHLFSELRLINAPVRITSSHKQGFVRSVTRTWTEKSAFNLALIILLRTFTTTGTTTTPPDVLASQ